MAVGSTPKLYLSVWTRDSVDRDDCISGYSGAQDNLRREVSHCPVGDELECHLGPFKLLFRLILKSHLYHKGSQKMKPHMGLEGSFMLASLVVEKYPRAWYTSRGTIRSKMNGSSLDCTVWNGDFDSTSRADADCFPWSAPEVFPARPARQDRLSIKNRSNSFSHKVWLEERLRSMTACTRS